MNRQIDIWDRPPNSLPVIFASGIYAQITGVSSTTQSPNSPALNQQIAWPRLVGSDISVITHSVVIRYMPGLKSRMYVVYNDPDAGPRRFDIDRIVDPDEQKVQLNLLVFERADGADPFDALLTSTADVLTRDSSAADKRGISSPSFTTIATAIACRVGVGKAAPRGKEERSKTTIAIAYRVVYMRPWFLDPSPDGSYVPYAVVGGITYNTMPLTHNHWLLIPSSTAVNSNNEPVPGEEYDIQEIDNPGLAHHHIEVACEIVQS